MDVLFFYGPGSRYSYLASTQLDAIAARCGATFDWRVVYSPDLIAASGGADPFAAAGRRGQYSTEYRARDAARWAAHYDVPYAEPAFDGVDWKRIALWCAGGEVIGARLGAAALGDAFGRGAAWTSETAAAAVRALGGDADAFARAIESGRAAQRLADNLALALNRGAFGVPTFVCADGALFWGQDRLPLLVDHLRRLKA